MGKVEKITKNAKAKAVTAADAGSANDATDRVARRAKRLEKLAKASTVTFTMEPAVRQFMDKQAKAAGMNLTHYMQQLVETHVIQAAPADDALGGGAQAGSRAATRARVSLNQQIGRVIKKAVGARSKRNESGKIARAQVQDALISTYTLLDKPD